jgi:hypothetical protein
VTVDNPAAGLALSPRDAADDGRQGGGGGGGGGGGEAGEDAAAAAAAVPESASAAGSAGSSAAAGSAAGGSAVAFPGSGGAVPEDCAVKITWDPSIMAHTPQTLQALVEGAMAEAAGEGEEGKEEEEEEGGSVRQVVASSRNDPAKKSNKGIVFMATPAGAAALVARGVAAFAPEHGIKKLSVGRLGEGGGGGGGGSKADKKKKKKEAAAAVTAAAGEGGAQEPGEEVDEGDGLAPELNQEAAGAMLVEHDVAEDEAEEFLSAVWPGFADAAAVAGGGGATAADFARSVWASAQRAKAGGGGGTAEQVAAVEML